MCRLPTISAHWRASRGLPNSLPGFAAQIIVDDVQYFNEGMFSDTVIAQDSRRDVAALGGTYFPSAGNTPPTQGYASDFRLVPLGSKRNRPGRTSTSRAFPQTCTPAASTTSAPMAAQDIAQTINLGSVAGRQLRMTMQWDDPYDVTPVTVGAVILQVPGVLSAAMPTVDNQLSPIPCRASSTRSTYRGIS